MYFFERLQRTRVIGLQRQAGDLTVGAAWPARQACIANGEPFCWAGRLRQGKQVPHTTRTHACAHALNKCVACAHAFLPVRTHGARSVQSDQQRMRESCNCTPKRCNCAPENLPQCLPADALTSFATPDWRPFGSAAFAATCRCLTCPSPCAASHLLPLSHAMTC